MVIAMDYKKKYKEALETVQEILSSGSDSIMMSRLKLRLQSVFPELKEQEDERIRKRLITYFQDLKGGWWKEIKPYLREMSSMTEEEVKEFYNVECMDAKVGYIKPTWNWHFTINGIDWLNAHHFDYRGLIEKGLALEAPNGMYGKEEQQ